MPYAVNCSSVECDRMHTSKLVYYLRFHSVPRHGCFRSMQTGIRMLNQKKMLLVGFSLGISYKRLKNGFVAE